MRMTWAEHVRRSEERIGNGLDKYGQNTLKTKQIIVHG